MKTTLRKLKIAKGLLFCLCLALGSLTCLAERPSAADFADELGEHWAKREFDDLKARADAVYAAHPDFIPAIIAASFIDGIFRGNMQDSREKVMLVKEHIDGDLDAFEWDFVAGVNSLLAMIDQEIAFHERLLTEHPDIEIGGSPEVVRDAFGPVLIPYLVALAYAPNEEIPPNE